MEKQKTNYNTLPLVGDLPIGYLETQEVKIPLYFRFSYDTKGRMTYRSTVFSFFIYKEKIIFIEGTKNATS